MKDFLVFMYCAVMVFAALGCAIFFVGCSIDAHNSSYPASMRKKDARIALASLIALPFVWAWPLVLVGAAVYQVKSLLRTAEVPTRAERREMREQRRVAQLEREKVLLRQDIDRLEAEVRAG